MLDVFGVEVMTPRRLAATTSSFVGGGQGVVESIEDRSDNQVMQRGKSSFSPFRETVGAIKPRTWMALPLATRATAVMAEVARF